MTWHDPQGAHPAQEYDLPLAEARVAQVLVLMTGCMQAPAGSPLRGELIDKAAQALAHWAQQPGHTPVMQQLLGRLVGDWCRAVGPSLALSPWREAVRHVH